MKLDECFSSLVSCATTAFTRYAPAAVRIVVAAACAGLAYVVGTDAKTSRIGKLVLSQKFPTPKAIRFSVSVLGGVGVAAALFASRVRV